MASLSSRSSGTGSADLEGRLLADRYRLNRPIASGGMAEVWEATDQILTRRVAVKLLHRHLSRDDSFVRRFRAEAIAAARLAHPGIVSVYDTFSTDDGLEAIVMELVLGTTLRADLDQHGPLRMEALLAIGTQVADALGAAHASGLVHRDVKPANILLSADGRVLVADFGIAKAVSGSDLTNDGSMVGTAKYLAPEQVEGGAVDGRTDLYALGVVLYEAITGQAPFVAETDAGTALARLHRDPTPPRQLRPDLPSAVEEVVLRAMARAPEARFSDAATMRQALLRAGADPGRAPAVAQAAVAAASAPIQPAAPAPESPPPSTAPPVDSASPSHPGLERRARRRWLWALLGIGAIASGITLVAVGFRHSDGKTLPIVRVNSFDPFGDNGTERDDLVANAVDDDPASTWQSEAYTNPDLAAGKGGVGLILVLQDSAELTQLVVVSPDAGWTATVYAAAGEAPGKLDDWGKGLGRVTEARPGTTSIDLDRVGRRNNVLLWFTHLPTDGTVHVGDLSVRGRS